MGGENRILSAIERDLFAMAVGHGAFARYEYLHSNRNVSESDQDCKMKSIMLELIPIDPGLDKFLGEIKSSYQIIPDSKIINRIRKDSIENIAEGHEYQIFENSNWLISGKIDDEEVGSIWIEVFKK